MAKNSNRSLSASDVKNFISKGNGNINVIKPDVGKMLYTSPTIDLRFLHNSSYCIKSVFKKYGKSKDEFLSFITIFQQFIYDFSLKSTYSEAIKCYASRINGSTIKNEVEQLLLSKLPAEIREVAKDELIHLHLKPCGKSEYVIFGFGVSDCFYVIALDPKHKIY